MAKLPVLVPFPAFPVVLGSVKVQAGNALLDSTSDRLSATPSFEVPAVRVAVINTRITRAAWMMVPVAVAGDTLAVKVIVCPYEVEVLSEVSDVDVDVAHFRQDFHQRIR